MKIIVVVIRQLPIYIIAPFFRFLCNDLNTLSLDKILDELLLFFEVIRVGVVVTSDQDKYDAQQ
jgi:hypothetical protein